MDKDSNWHEMEQNINNHKEWMSKKRKIKEIE